LSVFLFSDQVFELLRKQEETRQAEEAAKKAEYQAIQSEYEIVCIQSYGCNIVGIRIYVY
jgi:hypothetical protein